MNSLHFRSFRAPSAGLSIVCMLTVAGSSPAHPHADDSAWTYEAEQAARAAYAREDWKNVAEAYGKFAAANPFQASFRQNQAYALHKLGRHQEALEAWKQALELGFQPPTTMYNLACASSRLGRTSEALDWLERALRGGFDRDEDLWKDSDLDPLRTVRRFQLLTGIVPPENLTREQGWSYDLDHMVRRMEWMHYDLYGRVSRDALCAEVDALKSSLANLEDEQVILEIQRIIARVGDGHTSVMLFETFYHGEQGLTPHGAKPLRPAMFAVDLYLFGDGLFVRDAGADYSELVGQRVEKIGELSAHDAITAMAPYVSHDNDMGLISLAPVYLTIPVLAQKLGLTTVDGKLRLTTRGTGNQETTALIAPAPPVRDRNPLVRMAGRGDPQQRSPLPLYLRAPEKLYWHEYLKEPQVVYCQINAIQNGDEQTLADFFAKVMVSVEQNDVRALVIDLRHNTGGNGMLNKPLIQSLVRSNKINQPGRLFVITGRRTFSAAMNLATEIENWAQPIFVGEPTGSRPNAIGETCLLTLPWSKLRLSVSSLFHQNGFPRDERTWIAPRIPAELTSADYFSNRDPAMGAILKYLKKSKAGPKPTEP